MLRKLPESFFKTKSLFLGNGKSERRISVALDMRKKFEEAYKVQEEEERKK
jgi:hypothetical protein